MLDGWSGWIVDTPYTVMTTRAPAVQKGHHSVGCSIQLTLVLMIVQVMLYSCFLTGAKNIAMTKREIESGRVDIRLLRVGSPCHAPTYPALYKTSTEEHEKNIREISKFVNRQLRYHVRFWFSLFLTKAMSVSSVSHFTFSGTFYLWKFAKLTNRPERPLLLIYLVHFHQGKIIFTSSRFLPTYSETEKTRQSYQYIGLVLTFSDWCYGSSSNTI